MITKKMQDAINDQIQAELQSAHLYLAMSAWCEVKNWKGFASWLRIQHQEEQAHAFKLLDYLLERGGVPALKGLNAPPGEFASLTDIFENVLKHEIHVTELIHGLYGTAVAEKDLASQIFLQWFVSEQVEEEANASEIVEKLKRIGEKSGGIFYLDKELGKRGRG